MDRRSRRGWLRVVVLVALVVILGVEAIARFAATRLDDDYPWVVGPIEQHLANLERVEEEGKRIDVLIVGSSTAGSGIDPALLATLTDDDDVVYNAWLAGSGIAAIELAARELFVPRVRPRRVVIGLTSRELSDPEAIDDRAEQALRSSHGFRYEHQPGPLASVSRFLYERSALLQNRHRIREPVKLVRDVVDGSSTSDPVDALGMLTDRLDAERVRTSERHLEQERDGLDRYAVGGEGIRRLDRFVTFLRAERIEVVVVNLPVFEPLYLPLHPGGRRDYERYEEALEDFIRKRRVRYVDAANQQRWTETDFGDENHLNRGGAARLSALVAAALDAIP